MSYYINCGLNHASEEVSIARGSEVFVEEDGRACVVCAFSCDCGLSGFKDVSAAFVVVGKGVEVDRPLFGVNGFVLSSAPASVALSALIKSLNWLDLGVAAGLTGGVVSSWTPIVTI